MYLSHRHRSTGIPGLLLPASSSTNTNRIFIGICKFLSVFAGTGDPNHLSLLFVFSRVVRNHNCFFDSLNDTEHFFDKNGAFSPTLQTLFLGNKISQIPKLKKPLFKSLPISSIDPRNIFEIPNELV